MNAKTVLRSVATAVIIVGCAIAGPGLQSAGAQRVNCPGASCDVTVTVTGNPSYPTIAVSANELKMEKARRNVMITWKLVNAPDYEFRAGSISPHVGAATPGKPTTTQAAWDAQCTVPEQQRQAVQGQEQERRSRDAVLQRQGLPQRHRKLLDAGSGDHERTLRG